MGVIASSLLKAGAGATAAIGTAAKLKNDLNKLYAERAKLRLKSERESKSRSKSAILGKIDSRSKFLKENMKDVKPTTKQQKEK